MASPLYEPEGSPVAVADLSGTSVGRFAIQRLLGQGGMGQVYRADDTLLKRPVAIKRLSPQRSHDSRFYQRFLHEAERASALSHPNIAGIHDVVRDRGELFLVMEYVEGSNLRQRLTEPMPLQDFLPLAMQCCEALAAAHEKGIIHCDIKPENIMTKADGRVKVLDFGVAKQLPVASDPEALTQSVDTSSGTLGGTVAYMAPELLLEEEPRPPADIFSLGVVFYELLTGHHPFRASSSLATADRILHARPKPLRSVRPDLPLRLERVLASMMNKNPERRYASAAEVLADLRAVAASPAPPHPLADPRKLAPVAVAVFLALVAWLAIYAFRHMPKGSAATTVASPAQPRQLAVLPFTLVGGGEDDQAYALGLTETLNARLTQLTDSRQLQVVPATEVRGKKMATPAEARREWGVNLVLTGSFRRVADSARVSYEIVDPGSDRVLRAGVVSAPAADPFALEDQVVAAVFSDLEVEFGSEERTAMLAQRPSQPAAYHYYLRGRGYLTEYHQPENIESAIQVFNSALQLDPDYALAYAGLGEAYWEKYRLTSEPQWVERATESCQRASQVDSRLPEAHSCLGIVFNGVGKYEKAAQEFESVLEREPTNDDAYRGLARAYERLGDSSKAEATYRRAIQMRPQYWAGYSWLGAFLYTKARYPEAAEAFLQVTKLAPDNFRGYSNLGGIYVVEGKYREAIPALERSVEIRPTAPAFNNLGVAYFALGNYERAAARYLKALDLDGNVPKRWGNLAEAYYWTPGKRPQGEQAYRKAIALGEDQLRVNPRDWDLLGHMALYHAMLLQRKPALRYLEKALKADPDNPDLFMKAAIVHQRFGQTDQSLRWIQKALAGGIDSSAVRDNPVFQDLSKDPRLQDVLHPSAAAAAAAR